jgi:hypothetical protein
MRVWSSSDQIVDVTMELNSLVYAIALLSVTSRYDPLLILALHVDLMKARDDLFETVVANDDDIFLIHLIGLFDLHAVFILAYGDLAFSFEY